jgi:hypothetical protein
MECEIRRNAGAVSADADSEGQLNSSRPSWGMDSLSIWLTLQPLARWHVAVKNFAGVGVFAFLSGRGGYGYKKFGNRPGGQQISPSALVDGCWRSQLGYCRQLFR